MPTLDDLNTLKTHINNLGDELRLLTERGETMADVVPPEAEVDQDLENLLADEGVVPGNMDELLQSYSGEDSGGDTESSAPVDGPLDADIPEITEIADPGDITTGDDDLDLDELIGAIDDTAPAASDEPGAGEDIFSLDDLSGLDGLEEPVEPESPGEPVATGEPEDAFGADIDDLTDIGMDIDDLSGLTETEGEDLSGEPTVEEGFDGIDELVPGDIDEDDGLAGLEDFMEPGGVIEPPESPEIASDTDSVGPDGSLAEDLSMDDLDFGDAVDDLQEMDSLEDMAAEPEDALPDVPEEDIEAQEASLDDLSFDEEATPEEAADTFDSLEEINSEEPFSEPPAEGVSEAEEARESGEISDAAEDTGAGGEPEDGFSPDSLDMDNIDDDGDLGDLESLDLAADEFSDDGLADEDFSLDDLNLDDSSGGFDIGEGDDDEVAGLEDLDSLEDVAGADDGEIAIPDVEAAVGSLGDVDSMDDGETDELSLDDDLNFDEELGVDILSDIKEAGDDSDQFSMDDFGDQYNFKEGEAGYADNLGVDLEQLEQSLDEASEDEEKPFGLDEEDLNDILRTLSVLPRNLKIAIEEVLADDRKNIDDLKPLIDGLLDGDTPKALAAKFRNITKRKIDLPRSYEKRSGRDLEERRASLSYRLVREGWPVIRTAFLIIAIVWMLGAAGFMWIYRPMHAARLYRAGLDAIALDDVDEAVELFYDAWDGWPLAAAPEGSDRIADSPLVVKGWQDKSQWLEYARTLRRRKHWDAADRFYAGYLSVDPGARDVRLEYSEFLSSVLGRYENAINVLDSAPLTGRGSPDRDYMLAAGDVYLSWAEDDPTRYEDARYRYAKVLETSRNDEQAILSMMRYHLRIGDDEEVETLLPIFDSEVPGRTGVPELAAEVFAGLADWHLDRGSDYDARRFIDLALGADASAPEPNYADARYWRTVGGDESRELEALRRTLVALEGSESMNRSELEMRILTLGNMGSIYYGRWYRFGGNDPEAAANALSLATNSYSKALDLYEDATARNQLGASPKYGSLYLDLGDVLYTGVSDSADRTFTFADTPESLAPGTPRHDELSRAESYYNQAEILFDRGSGGSRLPDVSLYRRAYIRNLLDIDGALVDFHRVVRRRPEDFEARLALATALLQGGDYEASRSQYARTIELLDEELRRTGGYLNPLERKDHEELLIRYIVAWNNLGVSRARSAARGGGDTDYAAALTAFTMASEYYDQVYTDMPGLIARVSNIGIRNTDDVRIDTVRDGRVERADQQTLPYLNRLTLLGLERPEDARGVYHMYEDIPSDLRL